MEVNSSSTFRRVPKTGVIFATSEAIARGFLTKREAWANLGQGAPETGKLHNSPDRITSIPVSEASHEYTPMGGLLELRDAVAQLYNKRFRKGMKHQFSAENVAISSGGRLALTRVVATLGNSNVGHFLPDYTAYEELLGTFGTFIPIPISLSETPNSHLSVSALKKEIVEKGLSTILLSNPSNPTSVVLSGNELNDWIKTCRELKCACIFDEFYSHYVYDNISPSLSAAQYIENINTEDTIILDGLTKNWRYPGFRISWTIGSRDLIERISSAGSFLDGGASHPTQEVSISLIDYEESEKEAQAIRSHFQTKRDYMHKELSMLGIKVVKPQGSFYCWADLSNLPDPISKGTDLFRKAIEKNLIIVPGTFFDINPGRRRPERMSRFENFARFSFGPPMKELELGMSILKGLVRDVF